MKFLLFLMAAALPLSAQVTSDTEIPDQPVTKIAFGSCNNPNSPRTQIFDAICANDPDVFIFLGDNIYGDTENMQLLATKYRQLGDSKGYQKLKANARILATWDDHDYGVNDGGKSYPKREESQKVFLDFFEEPESSVRRSRPGVYTSYSFGEKGQLVQIILLDTRYFRDELPQKKGPKTKDIVGWYTPTKDSGKTLLGEAQWAWLEKQLRVEADVRIIASSIQVLAYEKAMENWGNVPHEQQRLFQLLETSRAKNTVMISGDVHFAELSRIMIGAYPLYDLTSSGLTHASPRWAKAKNSFRVGSSYPELNAGLIEINWAEQSLSLNVINAAGKKQLHHPVAFSELVFTGLPKN